MENTAEMILPIKKRRHVLPSFPHKTQPQTPFPVSTRNNVDFPCPRPAKRLCTENRNSQFKILTEKETEKESTDYLWGLFQLIAENESAEDNRIRVFGSFVPGSNLAATENKMKTKKKQAWWKSMVARGCEKFRREKMRLRNAKVRDLFSQFRKEEEGFQWEIEHKQDPFAFLSLPVSSKPYSFKSQ